MIELLTTFIAVVEKGSFSGVARGEGVAVSSVSRRVDILEQDIGAKLFIRCSRSLTLTEAGERLLPHARRIVGDMADAKHEVRALEEIPRGALIMTAPAMFGRQHVLPALLRFMEQYPQVEVELHLGDEFVDLNARRFDLAIRMGVLADSDLMATQLAPVRRLVCASPAYVERNGIPNTPANLLNHNCLTVASSPVPSGWWRFPGVNGGAALPVRGTFRSDDTGALLQAAVDGVGVVHLASWLVGASVRAGQLQVLLPDPKLPASLRAAIYGIRTPARQVSAKVRLLVAFLRRTFGSPPYWDTF